MRGSSRRTRDTFAVSPAAFSWAPEVLASLRHVSLPFGESMSATPLADVQNLGGRDRLSLVAQFAAHEALLQFAGVVDGTFGPDEWAVLAKRGSDVRLVRVAATAADASTVPPVLTIIQQFAEHVGASLETLRHSWGRAEAVYAEAHARLTTDAAADLRWLRASACGALVAPGAEGLAALAEPGRYFSRDEDVIATIERCEALRAIVLRGASPLARYSAVQPFAADAKESETALAERIVAATSGAHHVFIIANADAFDAGSRRVIEIVANVGHAAWVMPEGGTPLPDTRWFLVSPRLAARRGLDERAVSREWLEAFVQSEAFGAYLEHGELPPPPAILPSLAEPLRSYVGALALLGKRIPRDVATRFLDEFLFRGTLEELVVAGVTRVDENAIAFESDAVRAEAVQLIPPASRAALCRVAATVTGGVDAAMLWLEAGDSARAAEVLGACEWRTSDEVVAALRRVPRSLLTPELASRYGHALVDCGRYRDACTVTDDRLVHARAERRTGDYTSALSRIEDDETFGAQLLRAELLRLTGHHEEAARVLEQLAPSTDEERLQLGYERAVLTYEDGGAIDTSWMVEPHYLTSRFRTYVDEAATHAQESLRLARTATERIDAALDHVFALFSDGAWSDARAAAILALQEIEETQGDRAAAGILFTLAYLAADDGQWAHAAQRIARLEHYYEGTRDERRLRELQLLRAHLDFCRGRFSDARRAATIVVDGSKEHPQVHEAAALIVDEIDWIEGHHTPLRATGRAGNAELRRRYERLLALRGGKPFASTPLEQFREAVARHDLAVAQELANQLDIVFDPAPSHADIEVRVLRAAATRDYPFAPHDFDIPWCFATRNRLGHWSVIGSQEVEKQTLDDIADDGAADWIACSERELLFLEGCSAWPLDAREAVGALFRTRAEAWRLKRLVEQEDSSRPQTGSVDGIVGESTVMTAVYSIIVRIARRDVPVCVLGESGTGKELVARAIHRSSPRRPKTFTAVNCAALPENLIESELFGHVRGAFTGADRDRAGLIETTDGGTLFLDEIGEMPLPAQAKLLRFLQEGEFRRVGDTVNRSADVRIVSATNRKLETAVEEGRFREDLYYRIRGVEVALPPLRERGADVALLASHFLAQEREKHKAGPAKLSPDVEAILHAYNWPGNVRELQNTIRAAHAMAGDAKQIEIEHLPERLRKVAPAKSAAGSYQDALVRFRRDLIERSLLEARGNQNRAAAALKISRQALAYQIRELGILVKRV